MGRRMSAMARTAAMTWSPWQHGDHVSAARSTPGGLPCHCSHVSCIMTMRVSSRSVCVGVAAEGCATRAGRRGWRTVQPGPAFAADEARAGAVSAQGWDLRVDGDASAIRAPDERESVPALAGSAQLDGQRGSGDSSGMLDVSQHLPRHGEERGNALEREAARAEVSGGVRDMSGSRAARARAMTSGSARRDNDEQRAGNNERDPAFADATTKASSRPGPLRRALAAQPDYGICRNKEPLGAGLCSYIGPANGESTYQFGLDYDNLEDRGPLGSFSHNMEICFRTARGQQLQINKCGPCLHDGLINTMKDAVRLMSEKDREVLQSAWLKRIIDAAVRAGGVSSKTKEGKRRRQSTASGNEKARAPKRKKSMPDVVIISDDDSDHGMDGQASSPPPPTSSPCPSTAAGVRIRDLRESTDIEL
ncbi:hypothetical protein GGG16DRAFT_106916 [Schizophyllum commune]